MTTYSYSQVRKPDEENIVKPFNCYRAVGLALEKGHKFCKAQGFGKLLTAEGSATIKKLHVSGAGLQVEDSTRRFRKVQSCQLRLLVEDVAFVQEVVEQQRVVAAELNFNFWEVDKKMKKSLGYFDFLGDFSTRKNWGVESLLWVEMKAMVDSLDFADKLERRRIALEGKLARVSSAHPEVGGVLLLVTKVQKDGRTWQRPSSIIQLLQTGARTGEWRTLAGKAPMKIARGRAKRKPPLQHLWDTLPSAKFNGQVCFYVADFLQQLGLPKDSIKKRSDEFKKMIASLGCTDELFQYSVPGKAGRPIWLGSRCALKALYAALC